VQPAIDFVDPAVAVINTTYYSFGNDLARFAVGKPLVDPLASWSAPWPYLGGVSPAWAQPGSSGGAPSAPIQLADGSLMMTFQSVPKGPCGQRVCRCIGAAFASSNATHHTRRQLVFEPAASPLICAPGLNGAIDGSLRW